MRVALVVFMAAMTAKGNVFANTEKYCDTIAQMATEYVEDRNAKQPYTTTLYTIDAAIEQVGFSSAEKQKWRRDLRASAKIAYIDFPKISKQGISKLVRLGCMSE